MLVLLSGIGVEVASVSLVLKESQIDTVELKPDDNSDLYYRLTVKFIHIQSMTNPQHLHDLLLSSLLWESDDVCACVQH